MRWDLIEEASRWDLVPKPASLWWTSTYELEERSDLSIDTTSGCHRFPSEDKFRILGYAKNRPGKTHDAIEENAICEHSILARYPDIQRQGHPVEDQVSTTGGPCLRSIINHLGRLFRLKRQKRSRMGRLLCKDLQNGQEDMDTDGITFFSV